MNLKDLNQSFADGAKINALNLLRADLIGTVEAPIKVLGAGELKLKNLEFTGVKMSQSARAQVEKLGGKIG